MAKAAGRSSGNTELFIGTMKASVGLFGTQAKPEKTAEFDTAGPNGGVLKFEMRGVAAPVEKTETDQPDVPVHSDPLAGEIVEAPSRGPAVAAEFAAGRVAAVAGGELHAPAAVDGEFQRVLVEEGSGEIVEPDQMRRGVRLADGSFVDCTDQLAAIVERTKLDRMEIVKCIDSTQVRRERVVGSYYIGAQDADAAPKLRLLFEALRVRREVAIVKYTTRSRQQLGVIMPHVKTGTLVLLSLVFAEDFREPPAKAKAIAKAQVRESNVLGMAKLLAALHGRVDDLDELRDDAIALREELKARAEAGEMTTLVEPLPVAEEDVDLEDALVASLDAVKAGKV